MFHKILFSTLALLFLFLLSACGPLLGTLEVGVETPVAPEALVSTETPEAPTREPTPEPTVTDEPTPGPSTGTISGRVCYASESIPAMTAFFLETDTGEITEIAIGEGQTEYSIELPVGTYNAFAWQNDFQIGGAYTAYVTCGYTVDCTDHSLLEFQVVGGQEQTGVDICDWPFLVDQLPIPASALIESPLEGLLYKTLEGELFRLDHAGNPLAMDISESLALSPDQTRNVYIKDGDLFIVDLDNGVELNLSNTPNIDEIDYKWTTPERILFTNNDGVYGGLYAVNSDGTGLTVIDEVNPAGNYALSQDGRFAAYGIGATTFIYDLENNERILFDPVEYGVSNVTELNVFSPAWAPDGQKIAWMINGNFSGEDLTAVGVFDLSAKTHELLHPYQLLGGHGFLGPAIWSPNGNWIAVTAFDGNPARNGIWIVRVGDPAQSTEFFLGTYSVRPVWHPDGEKMVFTQFIQSDQASRVFWLDVATLSTRPVHQLPDDAYVLDW